MIDPSFSKTQTFRTLSGINLSARARMVEREVSQQAALEARRTKATEIETQRLVDINLIENFAKHENGSSNIETNTSALFGLWDAPSINLRHSINVSLAHSLRDKITQNTSLTSNAPSLESESMSSILTRYLETEGIEDESVYIPTDMLKIEEHEGDLLRKTKLRKVIIKIFGATCVALVLALNGYISVDMLITNNQAKSVISNNSQVQKSNFSVSSLPNEGEEESSVNEDAKSVYTVSPDLPRILSIDKINVRARILPMSLNSDKSIQAPININDSGWYTGSAKPGNIGAMFIDGHASGASRLGLFAYLDTLTIGDIVMVERGDGKKLSYKVVHTEEKLIADIDMTQVLKTYGGKGEGLNLMTCTGKWIKDKKTYDKRVIVYTKRITV